MKCFNHPKRDAVGMCSNCHKGVCTDCATEENDLLYCRKCAGKIAGGETIPGMFPDIMGPVPQPAQAARAPVNVAREPAVVAKPQAKKAEAGVAVAKREPPKSLLKVKPEEIVSAVVFGGVLTGLMMGLPIINLLLIWPVIGGAAAVYLAKLRVDQQGGGYIRARDGMQIGGASGVFGAITAVSFNIIFLYLLSPESVNGIEGQISALLSPIGIGWMGHFLIQATIAEENPTVTFVFVKLVLMLFLLVALGAVGGAIGAKLTQRYRVAF